MFTTSKLPTPADIAFPAVTVIIAAAVVWSSIDSLNWQRKQAVLIDFSGRQRQFTQVVRRELVRADRAAVLKNVGNLREIILALRDGGELSAEGYFAPIRFPPAPTPELKEKLTDQMRYIEEFVDLLDLSGNIASLSEIEGGPLDQISRNADQIVRMNVENMDREIHKIVVRTILLSAGLLIFGLLLNLLLVERKRRMFELAEAKDEAIRQSEAKSAFLANMSHEIRTPLNAVIGMSEVLETTALDADQNRYVKTLKRSAEALLELINDVLDIAKIESGQMQMVLTEFDLWSFVQRLADVTAFRAQQKGLEFTCYIASDVPRFVTSDANRLREVLANILGNAVKFTASGEIILRLELKNSAAADPMLNFSVSDTGIGIAERRLEMIFDKFSQAEPEISSDYGGTGLGLSICKSLVQLLGGTIEVKSRLGIGSTFGFSLPLSLGKHNQSETYPLSAAPIAVARKNAKPRLLVVDDMGDNRLVLRVLLGQSQFAIEEAADGGEAVQKHKGDPFDLIFMDLRMTPVDGCTAVESIRDWERTSGRRPVPIVVVTAHALKEDLDRAYLAGCSDHLIKPVNRIRLHQVLAKFSLAKDGIDSAPVAGTIEPLFGLRFNDYVQNRRADMSLLKTALQAHDFSQIRKLSHHISGTAGMFGLEELGKLGHQMDLLAKEENAGQVEVLIQKMEFCLEHVVN